MTSIDIIAGLGYSDEGKGRVCQILESEYDIILRCNGSWSSSHQITNENNIMCNHLPSVIKKDKILIVGQGMYVKPDVLIKELLQPIRQQQIIYISENCPVILCESTIDENLGTLGSGVRNACISRLNHIGKTLKNVIDLFPELSQYLITDDEYYKLTVNKKILVEGSHGYLIDNTFGEYPETTSTMTTPSGIMSLTKYSPNVCNCVIFVCGLFLISLGTHNKHKTYSYFGLNSLLELIPENIKIDNACGKPKERNFGPLDIDKLQKIVRYYPNCKIMFNFFDIIEKMKVFYYVENEKLKMIEYCDNFKLEIEKTLSDLFNTYVQIVHTNKNRIFECV